MVRELVETQNWGPQTPKIPHSEAKSRLGGIFVLFNNMVALFPDATPQTLHPKAVCSMGE
jgi:hypothetical protein